MEATESTQEEGFVYDLDNENQLKQFYEDMLKYQITEDLQTSTSTMSTDNSSQNYIKCCLQKNHERFLSMSPSSSAGDLREFNRKKSMSPAPVSFNEFCMKKSPSGIDQPSTSHQKECQHQ